MKKHQLLRMGLLALAGIFIGLTVYGWNARTLTGNQMPMPFGWGASVVLSGSMEPALSVDDLVIVREADSLSVGDVVVFQSGGSLVIHRVIALEGETVFTQGDANNAPDAPIAMSDVKGTLVCAIPKLGGAVQLLKQPLAVVLILLAAFLLTERSYRREKEADQDELEALKAQIRSLAAEIKEDISE